MSFKVGIIGYGKLGSALATAFSLMKNLEWIMDNDETKEAVINQKFPKIKYYADLNQISNIPDFIFITVPDSLIADVAEELSSTLSEKLNGKFVVHCSGAFAIDVLSTCERHGAIVANLHPYQTFFYPSEELFRDCGWSVLSKSHHQELFDLVSMLGGHPVKAEDDEKLRALYHCSAVIASNFMNTLLSLSVEVANKANIQPEKFIPAIVSTTIQNNLKDMNRSDFPLTGPYARADIETIKRHISALKEYPDLLNQYSLIALATLEKSYSTKMIDEQKYNEIKSILKAIIEKI